MLSKRPGNFDRLEEELSIDPMKGMREAAAKARAARVAAGLPAIISPEEKLIAKPNSRALAITCKCRDCSGLDDPHIKWRIGNCECVKSCPLYTVRPYQNHFGRDMPESLK